MEATINTQKNEFYMAKIDNKGNPSSSSSSTSDTKTDAGSTGTSSKDSKTSSSSTSDTKTDAGSTGTDNKDSKTSSGDSFTRGERQKVVTDSYRNAWDHIFEKKKKR